jgi:YegS/Rv2252/BmrU family lipid kinase
LVTVLLNPKGADAEKRKAEIAARLAAAGSQATIVELQREQDPAEVARAASARAATVVAAGGDGTVSRVAAGLIGTRSVLGVLPLGTLNHFAKDLRIPLDLEQAIATIAAGRVGSVDVGQVNGRVFLNNSSIGVYPSIVAAREELQRLGYRKWTAFALATFRVLRRHRGVLVRIAVNGRQAVWRTPFVLVGNNEYELDGIRLGSRASLDGGTLYTYLAPRVRTRELPVLVAKALLGRGRQAAGFEIVSAPELSIDTPNVKRVRIALDGEITTMTPPLHYRICPAALKVLLPPA